MIRSNKYGFAQNQKKEDYSIEIAKREVNKHKLKTPIDHPNGSITDEKLADGSVTADKIAPRSITREKLAKDVDEKFIKKAHVHDNKSVIDAITAADVDKWNGIKERVTQGELEAAINAEAAARKSADNTLQQNINTEVSARQSADDELSNRAAVLEGKAHVHGNKSVIDAITAGDIDNWNGIKEQVAQKQLDAAIAYFEEIGFSLSAQFTMLMSALGITLYDGGWFGEKQSGVLCDGGAFENENLDLFDCGDFEPLSLGITTNAITDGGTY